MFCRIFAVISAARSHVVTDRCKSCAALLQHYPENDTTRRKRLLPRAKSGVYPRHQSRSDWRSAPEVLTPMLFIFSKPNFVQIAWNSKAPESQSRVRNAVMPAPFGPLGFIRTRSVG
ncbi:hypothetical protein [Rhizobium herbae]|nr:hypothetical protein [Rhizobium herbae]